MTKYQNQSMGQCLGMCKGVVDYSERGGGGAMKVCAAPKAGVSLSIGDRRILRLRRIILRLNFDEVQYGYFLFRQIRRGYIIFK